MLKFGDIPSACHDPRASERWQANHGDGFAISIVNLPIFFNDTACPAQTLKVFLRCLTVLNKANAGILFQLNPVFGA
jgi:hypothetical protein